MNNHPVKPTDRAYEEAEKIWRSASSAPAALDGAVLRGESFASSTATKIIREALESIDD